MKNTLDNTNKVDKLIKPEHKDTAVKIIKKGADVGEKFGQFISDAIDKIIDKTLK